MKHHIVFDLAGGIMLGLWNQTFGAMPLTWCAMLGGLVLIFFAGNSFANHRGLPGAAWLAGSVIAFSLAAAVAPAESWGQAQARQLERLQASGGMIDSRTHR